MAVDENAALNHASALSSLGPHPWGSPRPRAAAAYVSAQLRGAGLAEVRQKDFEVKGVRGSTWSGSSGRGSRARSWWARTTTPRPTPRRLRRRRRRRGHDRDRARCLHAAAARTIVFASLDGEEAWSTGLGTTTGSRAYVRGLGPQARDIVAAFVVEISGGAAARPSCIPSPTPTPPAAGT